MKKASLVLLLSLSLILTSCSHMSENIIEKIVEDEANFKDIGDGIIKSDKAYTIEEKIIGKNPSIKKLEISNTVGKVSLSSGDKEKIEIEIIKKIESKNHSQKEKEKILKDIKTIVVEDKNNFKLDFDYGEKSKINQNAYVEKLNIDLNIKIPSNVEDITMDLDVVELEIADYIGDLDMEVNVGNILLKNIESKIDLELNVGNLESKNLKLKENSRIISNLGNVQLDIVELGNTYVEINLGTQDIRVANNIEYNLVKNNKEPSNYDEKLPTLDLNISLGF